MQLKQISIRKQDVKLDTNVHLVDRVHNNSEAIELTKMNLGSTSTGDLTKLIDLSNSVNDFFLKSSLGKQRDGIVGSCSYGLVYAISETLEKWGLNNFQSIPSEIDQEFDHLVKLLPTFLSVLVDSDLSSDFSLADLNRRIYFQSELKLEASSIRNMVRLFNTNRLKIHLPIDESCDSMTHIFGIPATIDISSVSVDHDTMRQDFFFRAGRKIRKWAESDIIPGHVSEKDLGVYRICFLANAIMSTMVEKAASPWKKICRTLTEMQSLRIKQGASIFALTTRPTSAQLRLFYKLDLSTPPFVRIEYTPPAVKETEQNELSSENEMELGMNTMFDSPDSFHTIL